MNGFTLTQDQVYNLGRIAHATVCENLVEYKRAGVIRLEPTGMYDSTILVDKSDDSRTYYTSVFEYMNWLPLDPTYTYDVDDMYAEFLSKTVKLAREVSSVVENQIRFTAQVNPLFSKSDWRIKVPDMKMLDIFTKTDGSENLKFNFVSNVSGLDSEAILGWVAYKFKFAIFERRP